MNYDKICNFINNLNKQTGYYILEAILRISDIDLYNSPKYEIKTNVDIFL